ncbi:MAG: GerMN domain-containing protein, partial [Acidimicrobiia bacterium]
MLPDTDAVGDVEVDGGVAIVDLREEFADLSGSDQVVAIAQVVFIATARPDADQVSFTLDGAS